MSVISKTWKFIAYNTIYRPVSCFENFRGTAFRQVTSIVHLNLKQKNVVYRTFLKSVYNIQLTILSRTRLSRITAYLEAIIWSLLKHENLTKGNKILWTRGEIAQQFLFSTIFSI